MSDISSNSLMANHTGYRQLSYRLSHETAEMFGDAWLVAGALAVHYENFAEYKATHTLVSEMIVGFPPIVQAALPTSDPLWPICVVHILLHRDDDWTNLSLIMCAEGLAEKVCYLGQTEIAETDWLQHSQNLFEPIILKNIAIVPHWHQPPIDRTIIHIDPGQAFGTGHHATTQMMLEWLEVQPKTLIAQKKLLDYGCGSGILAITAAKLHAHVSACDLDPIANQITQNNAKRNQVKLQVFPPSACNSLEPFDIILANILLQPLLSLEETFYRLLKREGGILLMSGILSEQVEALQETYHRWTYFDQMDTQENWVLIMAKI